MNEVSIFKNYSQKENHFTNGLFSLLSVSTLDGPDFLNSFLKDLLKIVPPPSIDTFRVLEGMEDRTTVDAQLSGPECCIRFETKIESGGLGELGELHEGQVERHWKKLPQHTELKKLVLLTPDDGKSQYVDGFVSIDRKHIQHLEWKSVYNYLQQSLANDNRSVFSELVRQFLELIRLRVFEQDFAGVILKVKFGEHSGVHQDKYLTEIMDWKEWNTPNEIKLLDGEGRKLIRYDKDSKSLTLEVEIKSVKKTNKEKEYPWTNEFVPEKIRIYKVPIPLAEVEKLTDFKNFGVHRSPYRKLTQAKYRQLMAYDETAQKAIELERG